jgi:S1-C subfamily serine protease
MRFLTRRRTVDFAAAVLTAFAAGCVSTGTGLIGSGGKSTGKSPTAAEVAAAGEHREMGAKGQPHEHAREDKVHVIADGAEDCPICDIYEAKRDSVIRIRTQNGLGTGVVIDDKGSVLTNAHVVGDADTVIVETFHGTMVQGTVERRAKDIDLAIVRVNAPDVNWAGLMPTVAAMPSVGSAVYVIGHPAGLGWTITEGIVSGTRRMGEIQPTALLQITAAVSPGNSGGPAFAADGSWIGTVSSKLVGPGLENISFVIPADELRKFLEAK